MVEVIGVGRLEPPIPIPSHNGVQSGNYLGGGQSRSRLSEPNDIPQEALVSLYLISESIVRRERGFSVSGPE